VNAKRKAGAPVTLDEELKRRLVDAAGDRSLNDYAVGLLADEFGFEHEPSGVTGGSIVFDKLTINLDMPLELRQKINHAHVRENERRELRGEPRQNRSTFVSTILRAKLDAAARATAA
jgi:hypothetical protein